MLFHHVNSIFALRFHNTQVYNRLNQLNVCMSYSSTLRLIKTISESYDIPVKRWIAEGKVFKFVSDNLDKQRKVRDWRSDHQGNSKMLHMYSIIAVATRVPQPDLPRAGLVNELTKLKPSQFLPTAEDVHKISSNLLVLVERVLTTYIPDLAFLSGIVPRHILHPYSAEMSKKSDVAVIDVLMKNEACHDDMLDIMRQMQGYLGHDFPDDLRVASGGDQLTVERQCACQRQHMDGDSLEERLQLLEPVAEDWHGLCSFLSVSKYNNDVT